MFSGDRREATPARQQSIMGRLRRFHDTLGNTQMRLHKMNTALLKVRRYVSVGAAGCVGAAGVENTCEPTVSDPALVPSTHAASTHSVTSQPVHVA